MNGGLILAILVLIALAVWIYAAHQFCLLCAEAAREDAGDEIADAQCGADWGQETHDHHEGCSAA